jgi:predicted transcriptional regulator
MDGGMGSMMDGMAMGGGTDPLVLAVGTLVLVGALGGVYLVFREEWTEGDGQIEPTAETVPADEHSPSEADDAETESTTSTANRGLLDVLPEDERRVLEPVVESPGITQIELRDRSDFSKSKVSQTVSALEKRGLLYREKQGRTYRVYPDDEVLEGE